MPQKARNADYTKEYNQKAVLRHLRRQAMSRAELARATGLTRAGTSLIVEELLKRDVVTELAPQSVGRGRSATPLALRADSFYALAVDLARKGCTVGLCDMAGKLLECRKLPDQEAVYLSAGLVNLLNLIPFDSIFLAGDICYRYELLAQRLQREIGAKALYRDKMDIQIAPVAENPNVGVLSAGEVVFSRFFTV